MVMGPMVIGPIVIAVRLVVTGLHAAEDLLNRGVLSSCTSGTLTRFG